MSHPETSDFLAVLKTNGFRLTTFVKREGELYIVHSSISVDSCTISHVNCIDDAQTIERIVKLISYAFFRVILAYLHSRSRSIG